MVYFFKKRKRGQVWPIENVHTTKGDRRRREFQLNVPLSSKLNDAQNELALGSSVTRLGDLLEFGQLFKALGSN